MNPAEVSEADVDAVGALLHAAIGLRAQNNLRGRLRRCIYDEASSQGLEPTAYIARLGADPNGLQRLVNRVTVQESGFFRHSDHFTVLADIFPTLRRPVTIWSSACANGQEAYSLAMLLEEHGVDGTVVATDLSTEALARTTAARYTPREVRGVSAARLARHFTFDGREWQVKPAVRARVKVSRHNLVSGLPSQAADCQVVFCRNVLIYLSAAHTKAFLDRLADVLSAGSFVFLGSAESLWQASDRFEAVALHESFVYRRRESPSVAVTAREQARATRPATRKTPASARRAQPPHRLQAVAPISSPGQVPPVLAATGRSALAEGDHVAAVVAFRKWVYVSPDDPLASFHLGLALEAGGFRSSALRAFDVSREAFLRSRGQHLELEGYAHDELLKLIDAKLRQCA